MSPLRSLPITLVSLTHPFTPARAQSRSDARNRLWITLSEPRKIIVADNTDFPPATLALGCPQQDYYITPAHYLVTCSLPFNVM